MAINNTRKGFIHTLEAVIATSLLITTASVVIPQIQPDTEIKDNTQQNMFEGLQTLDKTGEIRDDLSSAALKKDVSKLNPNEFNLTVLVAETTTESFKLEVNEIPWRYDDRAEIDRQKEWNQGNFNKSTADRANNLVGYWNLNENVAGGGGNVQDNSLNQNNGTTRNGVTTGQKGLFGSKSMTFDGVDDQIEIPKSESLNITEGPVTVSGWAKFNETGQSEALFGRGVHTGGCADQGPYMLGAYNNRIFWVLGNSTDCSALNPTYNYETGKWYHIVGTWDGTTGAKSQKLYINGKLIDQRASNVQNLYNRFEVSIGAKGWDTEYFNGSIDEVRIYRDNLKPEEVKELYEENNDRFTDLGLGYKNGTSEDNLAGFWRMDKPYGEIKDYSGYNNKVLTIDNGAKRGQLGVFNTKGIDFEGTNTMSAPSSESLNITEDITISFWARIDSLTGDFQDIITKSGSNGREYWIYFSPDGEALVWSVTYENCGCNFEAAGVPISNVSDKEWHMWTISQEMYTEDGDHDIKFYKDGNLISKRSVTDSYGIRNATNSNVQIGDINGTLDEFQIYKTALSDEKVKNLYFSGMNGRFEAEYSDTYQIPYKEVPEEIEISSRNVSSDIISWVKVNTSEGESNEFKLDSGTSETNYTLGFNQPASEATVEFNFSVDNSTPIKSPVIDNFRIWTNDTSDKSIEFNKDGDSVKSQIFVDSSNDLNISYKDGLSAVNITESRYLFQQTENEGILKFYGDANLTVDITNKTIRGDPADRDDVKNVNYPIYESGPKEVTVSTWN